MKIFELIGLKSTGEVGYASPGEGFRWPPTERTHLLVVVFANGLI